MSGWLRLGIFLSVLWAGGTMFFAGYEYHSVSRGGSSMAGFVHIRDAKTGKDLGRLSMAEVTEFGKLAQERSRSPQGDLGDAAAAKLLLSAEPVPYLNYMAVLSWFIFALGVFL